MAEKSFIEKLRLKTGQLVYIGDVAADRKDLFAGLPASSRTRVIEDADVILIFVRDRAELESRIGPLRSAVKKGAAIWVAYPKASSKLPTDVNRDKIWAWARMEGMDLVANFAVDDVWSAVRLKVV